MKARCGYKFDASVAKAAKLVTEDCPNFCPCCFSGKQNIEHWTILCPAFNDIRSSESDKIKRIREFFDHNLSTNNNNHIPNNLYVPSISSSNNNIDSNIDSNIVNNNVYRNSSVFSKVFNFLLGSRFYIINSREWKDLCNCQINPGIYSDTPFLKATAELLNNIIPIAFGRQRSLFNGFKKNLDKSVNAEISVRQASRASATNRDQNFVS